jgi:hypothetical protein
MRFPSEYGADEWFIGLPLVHGLKRARNVLLERTFRSARSRETNKLLAKHSGLAGGSLVMSIAFNQPWVIDLLTRMTKRHLEGTLIVLDNSRNSEARREIARICADRDVPYLGLPFNPERHPCRSNGIAMTWGYYNIVRELRPKTFAFFDHDLIPTAPLDIASLVQNQPVYGVLNHSAWGWNLWAGYCIYDFASVERFALDFNNDNPRLLDTGGRNWLQIYRYLDRSKVLFADWRREWLRDPADQAPRLVYFADDLLHVGGAGFGEHRNSRNEPELFQRLIRGFEDGATLDELRCIVRHVQPARLHGNADRIAEKSEGSR